MLSYSFKLALLSLRQRPSLTVLAVAAIAIGIGILMTIQTQAILDKRLPIGQKSENMHYVQMDSREESARDITEAFRLGNLTYRDAMNLINTDTPAANQTMLWRSVTTSNSAIGDFQPLRTSIMVGDRKFFTMFTPPFLYGGPWSVEDDTEGAPVAVISRKFNDYLFGGEDSLGRQITLDTHLVTVVGVLDEWSLSRKFYDGSYGTGFMDDIYLPHNSAMNLELPRYTRMTCWAGEREQVAQFRLTDLQGLINSECSWIHLWVELNSSSQVQDYAAFMSRYVEQQKSLGRFPRQENNYLDNIEDQLVVVRGFNNRFALYDTLAKLFFIVCLLNTIGILLAKFIQRTKEVALRRALGAKKRAILMQYLIEVSMIGFMGGFLGVLIAWLGLKGMMQVRIYQSDYAFTAADISHQFQLDWITIGVSFAIAVFSTLLVGLYPIWRICNIAPANQLKAQ